MTVPVLALVAVALLYSIGVAFLEANDEAVAARERDGIGTLAILCWQL